MKRICFVVLVLLAISGIASATEVSQAQLEVSPQDVIDWLHDHIVVPIENFLGFIYDQIIRVLQLPFDLIVNAFSSFADAVYAVFDSLYRAFYEAFSTMFR